MIVTMQLFQHHSPEEFIEWKIEKIKNIIIQLQRYVDVDCLCNANDAISLISTMNKIIGYAQSRSQTPSTSLNKIKRKAGQLFNASEDRKQIDELTKELEDILSLVSVSTCRVRHNLAKSDQLM